MGTDLQSLFVPEMPLEMVLRGSILYLSLFVLLRVIMKRMTGTVGITDLLVIVLIADASQNAMAGEYKTITDGIILVATLLFWDWFIDWLGYRVPKLESIIHPASVILVKNGRVLHAHMRQEMISKAELMSHLREQGIDDLRKVKAARIEGDGKISVIKADEELQPDPDQNSRAI